MVRNLRRSDVEEGIRSCRRHIRLMSEMLGEADLLSIYAEAEKLQHTAFDLKNMLSDGGTWKDNHKEES